MPEERKLMANQGMVKAALSVLVVALIVGSVYMGIATVQSFSSLGTTRTITVSGNGSVTLSPDEAQVTLGALTQADTAQQASSANADIMVDVIARLRSLGVANDSISTVSYYVYPIYSTDPNKLQTIVGYQAQHTVQVKISNSNLGQLSSKVSQVIDAAVETGANQLSGIQFTLSEDSLRQTYNQSLQRAIQDASSQAQTMASALGLRISGVEAINQGGPIYPPVYMAPAFGEGKATPIMPGTFTVTAFVQVTYFVQ